MSTTKEDFHKKLEEILSFAEKNKLSSFTLLSGSLHRLVGGYPGPDHRMPVCCRVMREVMQAGDEILSEPPSGQGATLKIRYKITRTTNT